MRWNKFHLFPISRFSSHLQPYFLSFFVFATFVCLPIEMWAHPKELVSTNAEEFSARMVWKIGGRTKKAQLFVKDDRYRIEHMGGVKTELGHAGVTIVRLDEQKVWYVISQRRMVVSVPLTSEYLLPFSVTVEGEIGRTLIGDSMVGDRSAVLYELVVQDPVGQAERFYEWVDPDRKILLKLLSQDRDWFVEYEHVVLSPQPEYYFNPPLGYRMVEAQEALIPRR